MFARAGIAKTRKKRLWPKTAIPLAVSSLAARHRYPIAFRRARPELIPLQRGHCAPPTRTLERAAVDPLAHVRISSIRTMIEVLIPSSSKTSSQRNFLITSSLAGLFLRIFIHLVRSWDFGGKREINLLRIGFRRKRN